MDGNKDDAEKCISIALKAVRSGDKEKARRFLLKAQKLYPSQKATDLLDSLDKVSNEKTQHNGSESPKARQRKFSQGKGSGDTDTEPKVIDYTPDQKAAVKRITDCKDIYQVLEVSKDYSEADLKKAYRKLALLMHPDKNKAPGSTEAFKAVGKAYSILSDKEKRRQYDLYGPEMQPSRPSQERGDYHNNFDGDISPEELFNMFFGGGFPSGNVRRRQQQQQQHQHSHNQSRRYTYTREPQQAESGFALFFQLAPILLLVVLSMLSSLLVSDSVYSLNRTDKYRVERSTQNLKIHYYVKDDFRIEYKSDLRRIERSVEEDYIGNLRSNCFKERNYKENMMWRARNYGDAKLYQRAQDMSTPSCDKLQGIYA